MKEHPRIIAHTDFDGVISALIVREALGIDDVVFAEPWMLREGSLLVGKRDIIVDLPYAAGCGQWFDHHASSSPDAANGVFDQHAKSCARVVFEHFRKQHAGVERFRPLVDAADKIDSASFTAEDLDAPDACGKLSIAIRGDEKRKDDEFRLFLLNMLSFQTAEQVINQPIIKRRVEEKLKQLAEWKEKIGMYVVLRGNVILVDRTKAPADLPRGQPFFLYLMYPGHGVYVAADTVKYEPDRVKISAGKNIFDQYGERLAPLDLGAIMQRYGGGGHRNAAGCSVDKSKKELALKEIVDAIDAAL